MIAPGVVVNTDGTIQATVASAQAAAAVQNGIGLVADGSLPIDTDAASGSSYRDGIRLNASGAPYGTTTIDGSDVYLGGLRVTTGGALVYEVGAPTGYQNGNPHTATGALAVAT